MGRSATISICGTPDTEESALDCEQIADFVETILETCKGDDVRVSGSYRPRPGQIITLD